MRDPIRGYTLDQKDIAYIVLHFLCKHFLYNPQIFQRTKQEAMSPCRFMVAFTLRYKLWVLESHDMFTLLW